MRHKNPRKGAIPVPVASCEKSRPVIDIQFHGKQEKNITICAKIYGNPEKGRDASEIQFQILSLIALFESSLKVQSNLDYHDNGGIRILGHKHFLPDWPSNLDLFSRLQITCSGAHDDMFRTQDTQFDQN